MAVGASIGITAFEHRYREGCRLHSERATRFAQQALFGGYERVKGGLNCYLAHEQGQEMPDLQISPDHYESSKISRSLPHRSISAHSALIRRVTHDALASTSLPFLHLALSIWVEVAVF